MSGTPTAPSTVFNVLGPLEVTTQPGAPRLCGKPATLLALLLLNGNCWVTAKQILDALWGSSPPASADRNVKTYIWQLRRALPPGPDGSPRLHGKRGGYLLQVSPEEVDATVMEDIARRCWPDSDAARAAGRLESALALWRGSPFPELSEETARLAVARLEQIRWQLRDQLAEALVSSSRFLEAVALLQPLTAEDPLREGLWTRLLLALNGAGMRAEALSCFQSARRVLIEELGVEPGPALQEAHRRALVGETSCHDLLGAPAPLAEQTAPSFLPRNIPDFVGRDAQISALVEAAQDAGAAPIAVVEGMPGVGKTALAIHVAHQLRGDFADGQVFCDLHGHDPDEPPSEPVHLLSGLLQAFGVPEESVPEGLERRAALWRSVLSGKKVLLVLDDAVSAAQVLPLLPGAGNCLAIITSRRGMYGLDGVRLIELDPLSDDQCLQLLAGSDGKDSRVYADRDASLSVIRLCGNLPAAIRIAASRLQQHPYWNPAIMARRLAPPESRLGELRTGDRDVAELLSTSYDQLSAVGQHVFRVLATARSGSAEAKRTYERNEHELVSDDLWHELHVDEIGTLAELPDGEVERTLEHLLDHHLVTQFPQGRYGMHVLLRQYGVELASGANSPAESDDIPVSVTQPA